jgi:hypothetical protein
MRLHRGHLFLWCVIVGAGNVVIATLGHPLIGSIVAFVSGLLAGLTVSTRSQPQGPVPPAEDIPSNYAAHHLVAEEDWHLFAVDLDKIPGIGSAADLAREEATPTLPVEAPATHSLPVETARGHHRDAPGTPICASLLNGGVAHSPECPLAGQV